jgi:photosystem II stability/assembly factor-like uncharacterized protein
MRPNIRVVLIALFVSASPLAAAPGWSTSGPPLPLVNSVAAAPDADFVVYATGSQLEAKESAIYGSVDGGTTWTPLVQAPQGDYWSEVFVDPRDTDRLFAGAQTASQTTTIYRSTDRGGVWNIILTISTVCGPSFAAGFGADSLLVACGTRLFHTPDAGLTWEERTTPFTETTKLTPGPASALYAYGASGIFRSSDEGTSWQAAGGAPSACPGILSLRVDPANALHYVAGTGALGTGGFRCGGVFTSDDAGATWTASDLSGVYVTDVRLDPRDPHGMFACASYIAGILPKGGAWRSSDDGRTWRSLHLPVNGALRLSVSAEGTAVHAATPTGAYDLALRKTRVVGPR